MSLDTGPLSTPFMMKCNSPLDASVSVGTYMMPMREPLSVSRISELPFSIEGLSSLFGSKPRGVRTCVASPSRLPESSRLIISDYQINFITYAVAVHLVWAPHSLLSVLVADSSRTSISDISSCCPNWPDRAVQNVAILRCVCQSHSVSTL